MRVDSRCRLRLSTPAVLPSSPTLPMRRTSNETIAAPDRVAKLVRQLAHALPPLLGDRLLALACVLGDRLGDGVVEAPIEDAKLVGGDGRTHLVGNLGDRLAHAAVVVNHLRDGEAPVQQATPCLAAPRPVRRRPRELLTSGSR